MFKGLKMVLEQYVFHDCGCRDLTMPLRLGLGAAVRQFRGLRDYKKDIQPAPQHDKKGLSSKLTVLGDVQWNGSYVPLVQYRRTPATVACYWRSRVSCGGYWWVLEGVRRFRFGGVSNRFASAWLWISHLLCDIMISDRQSTKFWWNVEHRPGGGLRTGTG